MRTIGLIGGMSWESSISYYQGLNTGVQQRLGGLHSAKVILHSLDFAPIADAQRNQDWDRAAHPLIAAAKGLRLAGAEGIMIGTNTMHVVADKVQQAAALPLLHIADAVGQALRDDNISTVGLLGTRFTMTLPFYRDHLKTHYGIDTLVPDEDDQQKVHDVIYQELCVGRIEATSKQAYLAVCDRLAQRGAQGIILGCTEIGLLINQQDTPLALYDSAQLHVDYALDWALSSQN
ncbi:aspartate/glutamate racemase family protein [Aestuariibacter halophilus]|uniref:Aspartate/glutamate racemase family protein n=1 Tax=Fluctibacter halophilus TaxID=226011 RepID=A0ABS8G6Z7_9ALTE|nr:aspartate/glutamate racemase family protein [Aestuariibacter halophilus]MCC2616298.1 aspartate/glutamate racemase family protein [Aestuariibacter halophilus]